MGSHPRVDRCATHAVVGTIPSNPNIIRRKMERHQAAAGIQEPSTDAGTVTGTAVDLSVSPFRHEAAIEASSGKRAA